MVEYLIQTIRDLQVIEQTIIDEAKNMSTAKRIEIERLRRKKLNERNKLLADILFRTVGDMILCYRDMTLEDIEKQILRSYRDGGFTQEQTAEILGINNRTIRNKKIWGNNNADCKRAGI